MKIGQANQQAAFNRSELVAVIALITLLSIIFSCYLIRKNVINRTINHRYACIENLRSVDGLKQQWALENKKPHSAIPVVSDLQPYTGRGSDYSYRKDPYREENAWGLPYCPDDPLKKFTNSYSPNSVSNAPTCKIVPASHILP